MCNGGMGVEREKERELQQVKETKHEQAHNENTCYLDLF